MKKYSLFCFLLTAIFYIIQVSVLGFTVYFLNENGFSASEVALLMAAFGVVAAITQPILGTFADKNRNIDFKNILTFMGILVLISFIILCHFSKNKIIIGLFFGIIFILTNNMSPFVNSSCFYYKENGIDVNFGIARGFGSFSFALVSYILGSFTKIFGAIAVSYNGIIASIIFLIIILLIPRVKNIDTIDNKENLKNDIQKNRRIQYFIKKYPSFFLMIFATIFALCFQNADCGYLINIIENLGGDSSHLGIANGLAALVEIPIMFMITRIMKKISVKKLIAIACGFFIVRGIVFCIPSMMAIYIAQLLQMFTYAILIPSTVYLSDEIMQEEDKNKGQTLIGMAVTMGLILGSFVGGELITIGGINLLEIGSVVVAVISFIFALLGNAIN